MARHRFRMRVPRAPKVKIPKPPKQPRPKTGDLTSVYKGLMTVSIHNRQASLNYALLWYDKALPYLLQKGLINLGNPQAPTEDGKRMERAVKARQQASNNNQDHEKETALLMAVRAYEKVCTALKPPLVDTFYTKFQAKRLELEAKQKKSEEKYGEVLNLLQKAAGDRVQLVVADAEKPMQWNAALTSLSYNREAAQKLLDTYRQEGLLAVFISQLDYLSRHKSLKPDGNGGWSYDPERHVEVVNDMLGGFLEFVKGPDAPKRITRAGAAAIPPQGPASLGAPGPAPNRAPRVWAKGPKVGGLYAAGSTSAVLYERLSDQKEWLLTNLFAGINKPASYLKHCLQDMAKRDMPKVGGTLEVTETTAKMTLPAVV